MENCEIKIYLMTESCLLREAMTKMLTRKNEMRVVAASGVSSDTLRDVVAADPDVFLCDSSLDQMSGINLIAELRKALPGIRVVLFGMREESDAFLRSVRNGVRGYLTKEASGQEIAAAILAVAREHAVCPPKLCSALFDHVAAETEFAGGFRLRTGLGLTRREQQLVEMLARGLTNKEIASMLFLSEYTIKNHVHRILKKLGASDRMAVVEQCRAQAHYA